MNGAKVGDKVLAPVNSKYDKTLYYDSYDVTGLIRKGGNTIGFWLGNGYDKNYSHYGYRWMEAKRCILQFSILFLDGTQASVVTDQTWKASDSPIVANGIYSRESHDARLEKPGWDTYGYDDGAWQGASLYPAPQGVWEASIMPGIKITETVQPIGVSAPQPGVYAFDLGQNIAGWVRLRVRREAGQKVVLRHAEDIRTDGSLNPRTNRSARATDTYVLKGVGTRFPLSPLPSRAIFASLPFSGTRHVGVPVVLVAPDESARSVANPDAVAAHKTNVPAAKEFRPRGASASRRLWSRAASTCPNHMRAGSPQIRFGATCA